MINMPMARNDFNSRQPAAFSYSLSSLCATIHCSLLNQLPAAFHKLFVRAYAFLYFGDRTLDAILFDACDLGKRSIVDGGFQVDVHFEQFEVADVVIDIYKVEYILSQFLPIRVRFGERIGIRVRFFMTGQEFTITVSADFVRHQVGKVGTDKVNPVAVHILSRIQDVFVHLQVAVVENVAIEKVACRQVFDDRPVVSFKPAVKGFRLFGVNKIMDAFFLFKIFFALVTSVGIK
jgi:hypothetical protein